MPPSMRRQAAEYKKRVERLEDQSAARLLALRLLDEGRAIQFTSRSTAVSRSTVQRLKKCIKTNNTELLTRFTCKTIQPGRPLVINTEKAKLINQRLKIPLSRRFAVGQPQFKHFLSRISADGCTRYANDVPSNDAVPTYRAQNSDLSYKRVENEEHSKLAAESSEHIHTCFAAFDAIQREHA